MNTTNIHFTNKKMKQVAFVLLNLASGNLHSCVMMPSELEGVQLDTLGGTPAEAQNLQSRKKTRKKKTNKNLAFIEDN